MSKLREAISTTSTILPLLGFVHASEFSKAGIVLIGSEEIKYANVTDKELVGCTRGYNGTSAAAHALESTVTFIAEDGGAHGVDLKGAVLDKVYSSSEMRFSNGSYITVSGDTIIFHNAANDKTFTITMA